MSLFQVGDFTLNSGAKSGWKLECDALTDDDVACLAQLIRQLVGPYKSVYGVPRGGVRLAERLLPYATLDGPHLIVDDVLTTGGSLERARSAWVQTHPGECRKQHGLYGSVVGAVVFARGQRPPWVKAVFQMPEVFWTTPKCR